MPTQSSPPAPVSDTPIPAGLSPRTLTRLGLGLLLFGVLWRTVRYLLCYPIWLDEALLAINFLRYDYVQCIQRLDNCQIAPLLFLWGERLACDWLGPMEYSLRLLPFLAGVGSLGLFWKLASLLLDARARLFATGFLAVAIYPVSLCTQIKQYTLDLFWALLLLVLAVQWLRKPNQLRWLVLLVVMVPLAILGSYTAVFLAGGVSLALTPLAWSHGWRSRSLFLAYNLTLLVSFGLALHIGSNHLRSPKEQETTQVVMANFWKAGFPPPSLLEWPWWLYLQTAGPVTAVPVGGSKGLSSLTCFLVVLGGWALVRQGRWSVLVLLTAPLLLNIVAAVLHRFPYGEHPRLTQHLAPAACLLAGLGLATALDRKNGSTGVRDRWTLGVVALFLVIGCGGLVRDLGYNGDATHAGWVKRVVRTVRHQAGSAPVVICGSQEKMDPVVVWNWLIQNAELTWDYEMPPDMDATNRVYGFHFGPGADDAGYRLAQELARNDLSWRLEQRIPYAALPDRAGSQPAELFCFVRSPGESAHLKTTRNERPARE